MRKIFAGKANRKNRKIRIGLALQGGGSYGAYTKGVLKALFNSEAFNSPQLEISAVTGTSAGAVNGALITYGLNDGGLQKAADILDSFWKAIGDKGRFNSLWAALDPLSPSWPNLPQSMLSAAEMLPDGYVSRQLKSQLEKHIPDWDKVRNGPVKLFVNAVREEPGSGDRNHIIFKGSELSSDTVTASGALHEFGAHKLDGHNYYDGAYWRNPCMSDIKKEDITDLIVITLQKMPEGGVKPEHQDKAREKHDNPGHELLTEEIHNHIAYIHTHHPNINLHVISLDVDPAWDRSSRMNNDPRWLEKLEQMGHDDAQAWLDKNSRYLGQKTTYEIPATDKPGSPSPS